MAFKKFMLVRNLLLAGHAYVYKVSEFERLNLIRTKLIVKNVTILKELYKTAKNSNIYANFSMGLFLSMVWDKGEVDESLISWA